MIQYTDSEMFYVASKDPVMNQLVNHYGHLYRGVNTDIFSSLVQHIIGQMLSNKAAEKINIRFKTKVSKITPENIARCSLTELKESGISRQKATAIRELAIGVCNGKYCFDSFPEMSDSDVINYLMTIKGVGRWTAEMIVEFTLGRLNIFCFQDAALKNGIMKAHAYKTLSEKRFKSLQKKYSPYCSVASLYYYALNDDLQGFVVSH